MSDTLAACRHGRDLRRAACADRFCHVPLAPNLQVRDIASKACGGADSRHSWISACARAASALPTHSQPSRVLPTGGHRSAGVARHPRICPRVALPHPQRPLADRRYRANSMLPSTAPARSPCWRIPTTLRSRRGGKGRLLAVEPGVWFAPRIGAASPATGISPGIPTSSSAGRCQPGWPTPSCASSSIFATAHNRLKGSDEICVSTAWVSTTISPLVEQKLRTASPALLRKRSRPGPIFDRMAHIGVHRAETGRAELGSASRCRSAR